MIVDDFRRFLAGGHRVTPPGSGRAAIRAWLSASHPGQPVSLHQAHALIGGQRIELASWVVAFLDVADRIRKADERGGLARILDVVERSAWSSVEALESLEQSSHD